MLRLRHVQNPNSAIWLIAPGVSIGASPSCDLVLCEPGIAQRQVEIDVRKDNLKMTLLSDTVATFVNGESITTGVPIILSPGDRLRIGKAKLQVVDPRRLPPLTKNLPMRLTSAGEGTDWVLQARHRDNRPSRPVHKLGIGVGVLLILGAAVYFAWQQQWVAL